MTRMTTLVKQLILLLLVTVQSLLLMQLRYELFRAAVCNKVFQVYLERNYGITVNLDDLYRSGRTWLNLNLEEK